MLSKAITSSLTTSLGEGACSRAARRSTLPRFSHLPAASFNVTRITKTGGTPVKLTGNTQLMDHNDLSLGATAHAAANPGVNENQSADDKNVNAASDKTPVTLLTLPGEIRNRIWECCDDYRDEIKTHRPHLRPYRGLPRVCHQVRKEFLPIYSPRIQKTIEFSSMRDFFGNHLPGVNGVPAMGVLKVELKYDNYEGPFDLTPIIKLALEQHDLQERSGFRSCITNHAIEVIADALNELACGSPY
ncbi:hypothetical protein BDV95DRAFT_46688 [Massariosphaeria phaeospora]|uniref:Uncharacterized protein n=1 Tax=Massariosphaeria phaeospora TaxID=100035 RepID=A0A7C8IFF5_9PLEO|nr:hypothetical protein BDV95DRAFT_46688 [Massariosphaeria phaeospora]